MFIVWYRLNGTVVDRHVKGQRRTPEMTVPAGPAGSLKATETGKVSLDCDVPSEFTT